MYFLSAFGVLQFSSVYQHTSIDQQVHTLECQYGF